ncbi:MAG TPA: SGNH hydrolase domain-containing protein [Acidimicrobiia bacterium]
MGETVRRFVAVALLVGAIATLAGIWAQGQWASESPRPRVGSRPLVTDVAVAAAGGATPEEPAPAPEPAASPVAPVVNPSVPAPPQPPPGSMLLMGDSIADSIGDELSAVASASGVTFHDASFSGCSIITGITTAPDGRMYPWSAGCASNIARYEERAIADYKPEVVVWMSIWEAVDRILDDGTVARFGTIHGNMRVLDEIDRAVGRLRAHGARVIITLLAPPPDGVAEADITSVQRLSLLNALLREYARQHADVVSVVDMAEILCPNGRPCPYDIGGIVPRPDGVHFDDPAGARWVAEQLFPKLLAPVIPGEVSPSAYMGVGHA